MAALTGLYISQSYGGVIHLSTNTGIVPGTYTQLQDGLGTNLNVWTDGTYLSASFSGSSGNFAYLTASGLRYPIADGAAGQFLKTDGNGVLSFADAFTSTASIGENYTLALNITGGALDTLNPVISFTGPTGENLLSEGWTVVTSSISSVNVSRPSTNNSLPITYFSSLVWNTSTNVLATRTLTNTGTANVQQAFSGTTYPSFSVNGITAGGMGFAAASDVPLYLVFNIATTGSSANASTTSRAGRTYTINLNFTGGNLNNSDPVSSAVGPDGENLITAGWTFSGSVVGSSSNTLFINRPSSNNTLPATYASLVYYNALGNGSIRAFTNLPNSAVFSLNQLNSSGSYSQIQIYQLVSAQTSNAVSGSIILEIPTTGSSAFLSDKYVVSVNITGGVVDTANPISAALGPYGEDLTTAGWSFSAPSNSTLEFTRSLSNQSSPIYYLASNAVNPASNLAQLRVASTATAGASIFSVNQVYSASKYTGGTIFAINSSQLGFGSGDTTANFVFNI